MTSEQHQAPPTTDYHAAAIARAEALCAEGNYRAGIDLLVDENRKAPSAEIERQLLNLRIEGFKHAQRPPVDWNTDHSGQFAGAPGLPEIELEELNVEALRAGILGKGGLIVRGLMDPERVESFKDCIQNSLLARKGIAEGQAPPDENPWFRRPESVAGGPVQFPSLGQNQYTDTGSVWAVDSPPSAFRLIEFYRQLGLPELLQQYFGEEAMLSVRKWVLRCVPPNNGGESGWHQDGQFMGDGIRTVNLWVALSDCGTGADAPGIDIVADNTREIYPTGTHGAPFDWTVGQGLVDEIGRDHPVQRPRFRPGDAVFFDHYNLHRTGFGTDHCSNRYAVESWFFAASRAPQKQVPVLL